MRTVVYIVACVVVLSVISCTSRNRNGEDVQILMRDSTVVTAPQRMQVSDTKTTQIYAHVTDKKVDEDMKRLREVTADKKIELADEGLKFERCIKWKRSTV